MITPISEAETFSSLCLDAWHQNADFWDKTRKVNPEIKQYIAKYFDSNNKISVIDIGCGNGWLYEDLLKQKEHITYCGVDYNEHFINSLENKNPNNKYYCLDFTKSLPTKLLGKFDFAISCLSLIEMADISAAFKNFRSILSRKGTLVLITLNPYFELIRLNDNYEDLGNDLTTFRADDCSKYYRKEILIDGKKTGRFYYGVLHTTERLINAILENGFSIVKFKELNFIGSAIRQPIYNAYTLIC